MVRGPRSWYAMPLGSPDFSPQGSSAGGLRCVLLDYHLAARLDSTGELAGGAVDRRYAGGEGAAEQRRGAGHAIGRVERDLYRAAGLEHGDHELPDDHEPVQLTVV